MLPFKKDVDLKIVNILRVSETDHHAGLITRKYGVRLSDLATMVRWSIGLRYSPVTRVGRVQLPYEPPLKIKTIED